MSWLTRLLPTAAPMNLPRIHALGEGSIYYGTLDDPNIGTFLRHGTETLSGETVNEDIALRNSTLYRAVSLICGVMGMLSCQLFRRIDEGNVEKARDHPLWKLLTRKPNNWMTASEFKSYMQGRLLFDGVAYAMIVRNAMGQPISLVPLEPFRVESELLTNWEMQFKYRRPNGTKVTIKQSDMFWIRGPFSQNGITGVKLVEVAAEALGIARSAERAGANVFKNGALVGGVLEHPKSLTPNSVESLRQQFEERHAGANNSGKWAVLEDGMTAKVLSMNAREAQMAEFRKLQAEEVARYTGVPRPLLMFDETSWGTGIEQLGLFFITYCLMPFFVAWEEAISRSLISDNEQEKLFAKFNDGALLRGSLKEQAEFFAKALGSGGHSPWMTQDEVRDKFNMNAVGGEAGELPTGTQQKPAQGSQEGDESVPSAPPKRKPSEDDEDE